MAPHYSETASDEVLLAQYVEGSEAAFACLVNRYRRPLFSYLYRLTGNRVAAEDLLQETFLRVLTRLWRFSPEKAFRPWLYTIATNLARNELRKRQRKVRVGSMEEGLSHCIPAEIPDDPLIREETRKRIEESLSMLDEMHRTVFALRVYGKLSYEEIAAATGCKPATARTRMFYALEKLRTFLEDEKEG